MGTPKWSRIPPQTPPPPPPLPLHFLCAFQRHHTSLVNLPPGPPDWKKVLFTRENTFCEDKTPIRYETQNASFFCLSVCLPLVALPASLITLCHPLAPPPSLSSDASLRAIEQRLSAFAGFSDFPEVPLIWKLNDSTQCQKSWGTIPELVVQTLFFPESSNTLQRERQREKTQAQSDDYSWEFCWALLNLICPPAQRELFFK